MKNLRKHILMICSILGFCFVLALSAHAAAENTDSTTKTGWVTEKNHKVYYLNGKKFTKGWKKIDNYFYYFEAKTGYLAVNKIVGSKAKGYYYVGEDGVKVNDTAMNYAVKFILKNTKTSDTRYAKLKKCFKAMKKLSYTGMSQNIPAASDIRQYAIYSFKHHKGNCFRFAADMTYITRALGYETQMVVGGLTKHYSIHGWCEAKSGNEWKIIDIRRSTVNLFMLRPDQISTAMEASYAYYPTISKGKISWKRTKISWKNY